MRRLGLSNWRLCETLRVWEDMQSMKKINENSLFLSKETTLHFPPFPHSASSTPLIFHTLNLTISVPPVNRYSLLRFEIHKLKLFIIVIIIIKIHDSVPPFLHMYFISVADWASTFPSGVTKKGIWPNGGRPARNKGI